MLDSLLLSDFHICFIIMNLFEYEFGYILLENIANLISNAIFSRCRMNSIAIQTVLSYVCYEFLEYVEVCSLTPNA